jgi:hypothetical protein
VSWQLLAINIRRKIDSISRVALGDKKNRGIDSFATRTALFRGTCSTTKLTNELGKFLFAVYFDSGSLVELLKRVRRQ